jgi:hypothetical protein
MSESAITLAVRTFPGKMDKNRKLVKILKRLRNYFKSVFCRLVSYNLTSPVIVSHPICNSSLLMHSIP